MDNEPVWMIERQKLTELLHGPLGRRVCGDVGVQDSAQANLHRHENVQHAETGVTDTKKSQATMARA
jgi:hypothetical protein